jgi:hypothetical protein
VVHDFGESTFKPFVGGWGLLERQRVAAAETTHSNEKTRVVIHRRR